MKYAQRVYTPIGTLTVCASEAGITQVDFLELPERPNFLTEEGCRQLTAYFSGSRKTFELPLAPRGTVFQQRVYDALQKIPFGAVKTYGEVALSMGMPKAARAVGQAVGSNPILILIPCHRVIGAGGTPGGFRCGLPVKRQLLMLEGQNKIFRECP